MSNTNEPEVDAGIVINPNSEYARECRKWEMFPSQYGKTPGRPWDEVRANGDYPRMLYRAQKRANGQYSAGEVYPNAMDYLNPAEYERAMFITEAFNKSCQLIVPNADERAKAEHQGWRTTAPEALAYVEQLEIEMAQAAAEAAHANARMSEKAQREFTAANDATEHHVVDVVPTKDSGKAATAAVTGHGRQK